MGMERTITFSDEPPTWPSIVAKLTAAGHAVQMRMIDNMPAFPDEEPDLGWRELRVSLGAGMITLRHDANQIRVIVWGNADGATLAHQEAIANACSSDS